ncbi:phage major capsid protein [Flavihumibacter sediminis]|nr:phage major capsid protein [Flavihumibacter sediminis]
MSDKVIAALEELNKKAEAQAEKAQAQRDKIMEDQARIKADNERMRGELDSLLKKEGKLGIATKSSVGGLGEQVMNALDTGEAQTNLKSFCEGSKKSFSFELKEMTTSGSYTGGTSLLQTDPYGIVGSTRYFSHLRDVLPKIKMSTGTIPVIRDNGIVGGFDTVAEGALKPDLDFSLAEQPAKAQVIAAVTTVTRQFIDDLGPQGVMNWMNLRMLELYLQTEDGQFLNGTGVDPDLAGVNIAGNFTAATSLAADNNIVQLVTSIAQMRTLGRAAKVIVINPGNLASLLLNTAAGSGEFDLPSYISVNSAGGISILGIPVIDTPAQTLGTFSVLDTDQMLMGIREAFSIRMFEQDEDNVKRNKITIRAESRIAFAVHNDTGNIKGSF